MSAQPSETPGSEGRWMTQQEAAQELGVSTEAVRMRVRRGSLESRKEDSGRVVVWVVSDRTESARETAQQPGEGSELVEALEARIESLERSLEHERESSRRKDHIIAGLVQRVPELEASQGTSEPSTDQEPREESENRSQHPEKEEDPSARSLDEETHSPAQRRSWWRRLLGR